MSTPNDTELLHRYVDGDLSADERAALEARAKADPTIRARLEGLLEVRRLVADVAEDNSRDLDADAMFAKIEARLVATSSAETSSSDISSDTIQKVREDARPGLRVIPGGASANKPAEVPAEVRRRRVIGVVIGALAAAAAAIIAFTQFGRTEDTVADHEPAPVAPPGETEEEVATVEDTDPARTEVLEVDFGTNAGTIFAVEGDEGERYVVVWLDDETATN